MKKYTNKKKTAITIAFMGILGLCAVMGMSQKEYKSTYASVEPSTQAVIYDDESYKITLTSEELNNYTFNNLGSIFSTFFDDNQISISYNELLFDYYDADSMNTDSNKIVDYRNTENLLSIRFVSIYFGDSENKFVLYDRDNETEVNFAYDIDWELNEYTYSTIKQAIELDIQANQPASQGDSIISAITSGLGLAPDVANEFVKGFTAVFWDSTNNSLTRVSNFMLVMLGIAIVMAIIKLSLSLIRSNTGA